MGFDGKALAPAPRDPDSPFALGDEPRSWRDFLSDAAALATAIPDGAAAEVMVACADRYLCAVALLAVWQTRRLAALPPNSRQETIDRLCAERGISLILHDGGGQGEHGLDVRTRLGAAAASGRPGVAPDWAPAFPPDRALVCVYTSGSTGAHVACPKTAAQLLGEAALLVQLWDLGPRTRVLASVPPHHLYGLLFGVLVPFMGGGSFVRTTPLHAETIAAQARRWQIDVVCSVPAHLHAVATMAPGALPPLARIFSSGAPLDARTASAVAAVAGIPVTEVLGSSETGGIAWRQSGGQGQGQGQGDDTWQAFPGVDVAQDHDGTMLLRSPFVDERDAPGGDVSRRRSHPRPRRRALRAARARRRRRQDRRQPGRGRRDRTPAARDTGRCRRGGRVGRHAATAASRAVGGGRRAHAVGRGAARRPAPPGRADRDAPPLSHRRRAAPRGQRQAGACPPAGLVR